MKITNKKTITRICKEVAADLDGWQYVTGVFVKKINKDICHVVKPSFVHKGTLTSYNLFAGVFIPRLNKFRKDLINHDTGKNTFFNQVREIQAEGYLLPNPWIEHPSTGLVAHESLVKLEIKRWIQECEAHFEEVWKGADDFRAIFEIAKQSDNYYGDGTKLNILALKLGEIGFVDDYYSGKFADKKTTPLCSTELRLEEKLPELKDKILKNEELF